MIERELTEGEKMVIDAKRIAKYDLIRDYLSEGDDLAIEDVSEEGLNFLKNLFFSAIASADLYEEIIKTFNDEVDKAKEDGRISEADYNAFYLDTKKRVLRALINYYEQMENKYKAEKEKYQQELEELNNV